MLSRSYGTGRLIGNLQSRLVKSDRQIVQNFVIKRQSGHNVMNIEPSNFGWKHHKNMVHFYALLAGIPCIVITTIINIRANPELTEIPDGYEPRHWEYYKHPITRWMAKYMFLPMEAEHEMALSYMDGESQSRIMKKLLSNVDTAMRFYNDHRTIHFHKVRAGQIRLSDDWYSYMINASRSAENIHLENAYNPEMNPVPTEGYRPID